MMTDSNSFEGSLRTVAFYLPQFYPFPENDRWWGKGFTEWTNVTKAQPLFPGHYQPHLPTDLGFYDLRLRETMYAQIEMAKSYGVNAFCYHYYWFSGKRLLDLPVDAMLNDSKLDMPFMLCWANENWTRRWDGSENTILISQKYQKHDDINFIKSIIPFFQDKRYLRVGDAPALIVYRPQNLHNVNKTLKLWREYCASIGIPKLYLISALVHGNQNYEQYGFDAGVQFPPHAPQSKDHSCRINFYKDHKGCALDYIELAELYVNKSYSGKKVYRTVVPSWDNTARLKERATFCFNADPKNYEYWLKLAKKYTQEHFKKDGLLFINAWNEWAEGCHLEPDRMYGHQYLEATKRVISGTSQVSQFSIYAIPAKEKLKFWHVFYRKQRTFRNFFYKKISFYFYPILQKYPIIGFVKRKIINSLYSIVYKKMK